MLLRGVAIAVCIAACGEVADHRTPADAALDAAVDATIPPDAAPPQMYQGSMAETQAVMFGGPSLTDPTLVFCKYTITLKELDVELTILPSGQVTAGRVQDLNVETVIVSTTPNCPANIAIPPNIATYTLQSTTPGTGGMTLTFRGATTNKPGANLTALVTPTTTGYSAMLTFQRFGATDPVLHWKVNATVALQR